MIEPFLSAVSILKKLEVAGYEAYFVGGSVRDFLLGKQINDVDIATSATPLEMKRIFPKTVDVGIEHGTILVLEKDHSYEVTTFRTESEYVDFRRPKEVAFIRSLHKDLERRDFTMNAMAMNRNGQIIDPFNGQKAIKEKRIETVGIAEERFQEDALRIMRAIRFVSQISFEIEPATLSALKESSFLLEKIATERKLAEFEKLLSGASRRKAMQLLVETEVFRYLPGLEKMRLVLEKLSSYGCEELDSNEMWSLLLYDSQLDATREVEEFLRGWKLPVKRIKEIKSILLYVSKRVNGNWTAYDLYCARLNTIQSAEKVFQTISGQKDMTYLEDVLERYWQLPIKDRSEIAMTGSDLIDWFGQPGGPWVSEMLEKAERAIVKREVANQKDAIKEWLLKCNRK